MRTLLHVFKSYLFNVSFGYGSEPIGATAVWSTPFAPELWIGAVHAVERKMLRDAIDAGGAAGTAEGPFAITLMHRDGKPGRRVRGTFKGYRSAPFDLDAREDGTAIEWLILEGVSYGVAEDL